MLSYSSGANQQTQTSIAELQSKLAQLTTATACTTTTISEGNNQTNIQVFIVQLLFSCSECGFYIFFSREIKKNFYLFLFFKKVCVCDVFFIFVSPSQPISQNLTFFI